MGRSPGKPFCRWLVWPLWYPLTPNWAWSFTSALPSWILTRREAVSCLVWSQHAETVQHQASPPASFSVTGWAFPLPLSRIKGIWLSLTLPSLLSANPLSHQAMRSFCNVSLICSLLSTCSFHQCQLWFPCMWLLPILYHYCSPSSLFRCHQPLEDHWGKSLVLSQPKRDSMILTKP